MSAMFKQLQSDQLVARKARDTVKINLLTTLLGDVLRSAKDEGNREVTDADVVKALRKFVTNAKDNIQNYERAGKTEAVAINQEELTILQGYLPAEVDETTLRNFIQSVMTEKNLPKAPASMKVIMAELNAKFGTALDKKVASSLAQEVLKP